MAGKGKSRGKAAKGYQLPEPIPEGFDIADTTKKTYVIGPKIASGGFGTVYFASDSKKTYDYVVKVEPHGNGPLFTEMHCYQNCGKPAQLTEYIKKKKLQYLGLSPCIGTGSFMYNSSKYRFMTIERYGKDLQSLLDENGHVFPAKTVYLIGLSVLTTLEYIHSAGYVHGDVKAANLLLGYKKGTENQVYLVDMGLACKYNLDGVHKAEKPDTKKAHNGTPEFTSRDGHKGCFSRRSDLEILCYNLLQWLVGKLPWECYKTDNKKLQQEKEKYMQNVSEFLDELFEEDDCPVAIKKLCVYVSKLGFEDEPDYKLCKKLLTDELKKIGGNKDDNLVFGKVLKKKVAAKKVSNEQIADKENAKKPQATAQKRKPEPQSILDDGEIPTPAMLEIMKKREEPTAAKTRRKK